MIQLRKAEFIWRSTMIRGSSNNNYNNHITICDWINSGSIINSINYYSTIYEAVDPSASVEKIV